jgi:hypothetical protein
MRQSHRSKLAGTAVLLLLVILFAGIPAMAAPGASAKLAVRADNWLFADFDGDQKPDFAELRRSSLDIRLNSGSLQHLTVSSDEAAGLQTIAVVDIDGDNDLDIVVQNRFVPRRAEIWINDGNGRFPESPFLREPVQIERKSWNPVPASLAEVAVPVKPPQALAGPIAIGFIVPPPCGTESEGVSVLFSDPLHKEIPRLRAPPTSFLS